MTTTDQTVKDNRRTSTEAMRAEADRRREQGYEVTAQWHEEIGDWYVVWRAADHQPLEVIYERTDTGRAYSERINQDDPTVNPYTFVDDLLLKTTEGRWLY